MNLETRKESVILRPKERCEQRWVGLKEVWKTDELETTNIYEQASERGILNVEGQEPSEKGSILYASPCHQ